MKLKKLVLSLTLAFSCMSTQAELTTKYDFSFMIDSPPGTANFSPTQVFTDGEKTWLQFKHPENAPAIFANDNPLKYRVEFPYVVIDGLYQNMSVVVAGEKVSNIDYNGRFATSIQGTTYSTAAPNAVNSSARMPVPVEKISVEKKAPVVNFVLSPESEPPTPMAPQQNSSVIVAPYSAPKIDGVKLQPENKPQLTGNFSVSNEVKTDVVGAFDVSVTKDTKVKSKTKLAKKNEFEAVSNDEQPEKSDVFAEEKTTKPVVTQQDESQPVDVSESFFVARGASIGKDKIEQMKQYIASGGKISLAGSSGNSSASARKEKSLNRAKELKKTLGSMGIKDSSVVINEELSGAKVGFSGAQVIFN